VSIITSALKKAQDASRNEIERKPRIIAFEHESLRIKKTRHPFLFYALILGGFALIVSATAIAYKFYFRQPEKIIAYGDFDKAVPGPSEITPVEAGQELAGESLDSMTVITEEAVSEEIKLTGIMYTQAHPLAVINDNVWSEGEDIGKFRIVKIGKDFVKVASDNKEFTVKLKR